MTIHLLNCFTCNARFADWKTGTLCLLVETNQGLTLVDTGLGLADYSDPTWFTKFFRVITEMPFDPNEAAINQVRKLGYKPEDVKHIILTHMHFDHCGGLPDFPNAKIHVHRKEYEAFKHQSGFLSSAYIQRNIAHDPNFILYDDAGEKWFDFNAIRLMNFEPEIYFIPMPYHTRGMSGIAIKTESGWHFHCGDAAADFRQTNIPEWSIRLMLGPYMPRLRAFREAHPEITVTASHMFLDYFQKP
jgi:glyoxylase-like metal-dependent hydrolase (beta-lactamase superfamily II)